jgi:integrase
MTLATLARTYLAEPKPCSRAALMALPIVTRADALKSVRFHALRHSHLSMLLKSGVPVHAVAARARMVAPLAWPTKFCDVPELVP